MKVAIITGSRADWNGLGMVAKELCKLSVNVQVIAIGQHAEITSGEQSLGTIIDDGFDPILTDTNYREDMAHGLGRAAIAIANTLDSVSPDMALVLGDRFEILGAASAVALRSIPLAHIGGGDITEGSIDNKLRYAISALADLHFVTNTQAVGRIDVRYEPHVYNVGAPALDRIRVTPIIEREAFFKQLQLTPSKHNILVAYHAATREENPLTACYTMLAVLRMLDDVSFLVIGTNADNGSSQINEALREFCLNAQALRVMRDNLSPEMFYSALSHMDCMVGNSSAGMVETAGFGIPVVNIGDRQSGRPAADNVTNCSATFSEIMLSVKNALTRARIVRPNPYGDGHSAPRIAKIIHDRLLGDAATVKVEGCLT